MVNLAANHASIIATDTDYNRCIDKSSLVLSSAIYIGPSD